MVREQMNKIPREIVEKISVPDNIILFLIADHKSMKMKLPYEAWKIMYDYQESSGKGVNQMFREALSEYFDKRGLVKK